MGYSIYRLKSEIFIHNDVQSDALFSIKNLIKEFSTS
jgi:hypothetical protein